MPDQFTEISRTGCLGRIGGAIKGLFVGALLFLLAFPLLFWGEFRAVAEYKRLKAGRGAVVEAPEDRVDKSLNGKLVHVTGTAKVKGKVEDSEFPVSATALKLVRNVEMYQWKETTKKETRKKLGGSEETVTTYHYNRVWSSSLIRSNNFKHQVSDDGRTRYENPARMPYKAETQLAGEVTMGPYRLTDEIIKSLGRSEPLNATKKTLTALPDDLKARTKLDNGALYIGANPQKPQVGDVRISFQVSKPGPLTVISGQQGNSFKPYTSKEITKGLQLVSNGKKTADEMFSDAEASNAALTWVLRVVGWLMMFIGLTMIFKPLSVVADVIPLIGSAIGAAAGVVAFFLSAFLSLVTIAIAWVLARPILGILLLLVAGVMFAGVVFMVLKYRKKKPGFA